MTTRRILVAVALLFGSFGAACGDDDDDSASGGDELTETEFLAQANQVCADGEAELDKAGEAAFPEDEQPSAEDMERFLDETVVPNVQQQLDDIRALNGPDDIEEKVDAVIDLAEARNNEIRDMDADAVYEMFTSNEDPFAEVNEKANEVGLTTCGSDA